MDIATLSGSILVVNINRIQVFATSSNINKSVGFIPVVDTIPLPGSASPSGSEGSLVFKSYLAIVDF